MFESYNKFEQHEHNFNVFFATAVATILSLLIGGVLAALDFFNNSATWFVFLILVVVPMIVFIATSRDAELKPAYYKTWRDKITGLLDQDKILDQFAKQYKIDNWRTKLKDIEVDGRWNFHADTNYMHGLAAQRDLLLSQLKQDYQNALAIQNKIIIDADRNVVAAEIDYSAAQKSSADLKSSLDKAKTSAAVFQLSQDYKASLNKVKSYEMIRNDAVHRLKSAEEDRTNLLNNYNSAAYRIIQVYYERYSKYTETAIGKINQINGLKYSIVDMPSPESWAKDPARKELQK